MTALVYIHALLERANVCIAPEKRGSMLFLA
jgi:hypothetical protein